jgi:hypothetical protein
VKSSHINDISDAAAGSLKDCGEIVEGELDLTLELGLWRAVGSAADLA